MRFSIVITTHNRLSFLKRAIDSAINQTVNCEVVVVDDASSDGTEEYVKSLGDRVVYHRNNNNLGHSKTVNEGVKIASGDWIKLLDDDDYLAAECIEKLTNAIAFCPKAVLCSCQAIQVDINEVEISRTKPSGIGEAFYLAQEDIHYGMLLEMVPFGTPVQVAFRRDAFLQSGGWNTAFDGNCDDIDSWIKIAQFGDAIFLNDYLAYRTIWVGGCNHKFSLQTRLETNFLLKKQIYQLVSEKYRSSLPDLELIYSYLKLHWFLVGIKNKQSIDAIKLAGNSILSLRAWLFLVKLGIVKVITQQYLAVLYKKVPQLLILTKQKEFILAVN
jgi:glycosyltransferase involved in cell wall biosynthesis